MCSVEEVHIITRVPQGCPSRGGDAAVYVFDINQPSLSTPYLFCSCVYFCLHGTSDCISFHRLSWQLDASSLCSFDFISALLILSAINLFMTVFFNPDITLCGWLGSKHQLSNWLINTFTSRTFCICTNLKQAIHLSFSSSFLLLLLLLLLLLSFFLLLLLIRTARRMDRGSISHSEQQVRF